MSTINSAALAALIENAANALAAAEDEYKRAQETVDELRQEHDVLVRILRRQERQAVGSGVMVAEAKSAATAPAAEGVDWVNDPRTTVVEQALRHLWSDERTVAPANIYAFLVSKGRDDNKDRISAALAHLAHKGRVHRVGSASWAPGSAPTNTEGPASARPSDGTTARGQEGGAGTYAEGPGSRDHGYPVEGEDRDHDRGAPVVF
jgi:hypothetical protein